MKRIIVAFCLGLSLIAADDRPAAAAAADYVFEAVQAKLPPNANAVISVRLMDRRSAKPVTNAVIFRTRLDMSPDGMADMSTPVTPLPPAEPGLYRFQADLSMAGRWALALSAKVPGEAETVHGEVVVTATK